MAGEIGHFQCIEEGSLCSCGNRGCLETLTSATAIAYQGMVEEAKGTSLVLTRILREKGKIRSWDVIKEARKGEPVCAKIVEEAGRTLGKALGNIFLVFAPERILVGGGVAKAGPLFLNGIRDGFKEAVPRRLKNETIIFLAKLGNDAGMVGLGKYIKMNLNNKGEKNA
jgi:glucokinase